MHVVLWMFRVRPGREAEFKEAYGPEGEWVRLFRRDPRYAGSDLMRGTDGRYLSIDRWESAGAFAAFRAAHGEAYDDLDRRFEALTVEEKPLGAVDV